MLVAADAIASTQWKRLLKRGGKNSEKKRFHDYNNDNNIYALKL